MSECANEAFPIFSYTIPVRLQESSNSSIDTKGIRELNYSREAKETTPSCPVFQPCTRLLFFVEVTK